MILFKSIHIWLITIALGSVLSPLIYFITAKTFNLIDQIYFSIEVPLYIFTSLIFSFICSLPTLVSIFVIASLYDGEDDQQLRSKLTKVHLIASAITFLIIFIIAYKGVFAYILTCSICYTSIGWALWRKF